jgi:tRNA (cytosine34-C5)-methyltransferase
MGRLVFGDAGEATEAEAIVVPLAAAAGYAPTWGNGSAKDVNDETGSTSAWQGPGKRKQPRSRSLGRARKQKLGALNSQQPEAADVPLESATVPDTTGTLPWPDCDAPRGKSLMKYYYRLQRIVPIQEWDSFDDGIHRPLPVTFRFSANADAAYRTAGESILESWARQRLGTRRLGVVDGRQLHIDKHALRAATAGTAEATLREWMITGTTSGKLIRQEVASMLPAVVLGVLPGHTVLDMCAAPGSKTSQIVEMLDGKGTGGTGSAGGVVVANDNDAVRAYTLVKRIADLGASKAGTLPRSNAWPVPPLWAVHRSDHHVVSLDPSPLQTAVLVTLHKAQQLPKPSERPDSAVEAASGGYDRIICDVPCTGDGTTRKQCVACSIPRPVGVPSRCVLPAAWPTAHAEADERSRLACAAPRSFYAGNLCLV